LYVEHTEGVVPKCTKRFLKLGLEGDCLKENAPYRSAATGVPIGRAHTNDLSKMTIKLITKFCSVAVAIVAIVFAQLGPGDWQLRTGLGWKTEHVLAYFVVTSIVCLVWPRPFVVGPALMAASVLLEALQALTPDRHVNFLAGLCGAGGALAAALLAELFIRVWRWDNPLKTVKIAGALAVVAFAVLSLVPRELRPHTGAPESIEHVAAYALAGALLIFGYGKRSQPFIIILSLSLYAAILEIAQIWAPGRNPQFTDFVAGSAGALIGSALAWIGLRAGRLRAGRHRKGRRQQKGRSTVTR
jgi:VanZ family protein